MLDGKNPYRPGEPKEAPFVGREKILDDLLDALRSGRRALAAVMGGRGMGKTSLAHQLKRRLEVEGESLVRLIARPDSDPRGFLAQLEHALGLPLDPLLPVESLIEAIEAIEQPRAVLVIDEVDNFLRPGFGRDLLENLRAAYEQLGGKLGIVILGGSSLRELLTSQSSPFLRTARWTPLYGLTLGESATLIREPLHLSLPDSMVETLWEQTGGHPYLLQFLMERVVTLGGDLASRISEAMSAVEAELATPLFDIWWDNLTPRGQAAYRKLASLSGPLERREWARALGNGPDALVEILATTGVARADGGRVVPRGTLFHEWMMRNYPSPGAGETVPPEDDLTARLAALQVHPFERSVVEGIADCARTIVEFPTFHLRTDPVPGNGGLVPEDHFQIMLLTALRQRHLAEPEALSGGPWRSDIKVRWRADTTRRACVEVKIWNHTGYKEVVEQALKYSVRGDEFACVVMVDRQQGPLGPRYREVCLQDGKLGDILWQHDGASGGVYPAFITRHQAHWGGEVRVHHFLVQLPPGAAT